MMKHLSNIFFMLVFFIGLAVYGNTSLAWFLLCLPLVVWYWHVLGWFVRFPRLMAFAWFVLLCFQWPAALGLSASVIIVLMFKQRHGIAQERSAKRRQKRRWLLESYDYDFRTFTDD